MVSNDHDLRGDAIHRGKLVHPLYREFIDVDRARFIEIAAVARKNTEVSLNRHIENRAFEGNLHLPRNQGWKFI